MNVKRITSTILSLLLALPSLALAQSAASSDWSAVRSISHGEKVSVNLKDGKKLEGRLLNVTDTTLAIDRKGSSTDLDRQSIKRVHRLVPKSTGKSIGKSALIGAGVGFGAGAGVALAAGSYEDIETAGLVAFLGGIGAGIGAGIGVIAGAITGSGNKKVLVYEAR